MVQSLEPADPAQVGRYRLLGRLGRGGMGQVFLGQSPGGRLVAVKVIRPELADDPAFRARFAQEVATARTVGGIFTVPVVDADVSGPQPWLVTAYVDGPSLYEAISSQGPLSPDGVLGLAAGLAEGLEAIHAAGVVHRDLKPSNVLLASDGPRIIDFGISRALDAASLTRTGWIAGSPGFMSPEQARGEPASPPSDIFSLGSLLAFAATGDSPFGAGLSDAVLYRVVHGQPDTSRLSPRVRSLVEHCLAKDPRQRPTAAQIVAGLGPGLAAGPGPAAAGIATQTVAPPAAPLPPPHQVPPHQTPPYQVPSHQPDPYTLPEPTRRSRRGGSLAWAFSGAAAIIAGIVTFAVLVGARHSPSVQEPAAAVSSTAPGAPASSSLSPSSTQPSSAQPNSAQPSSTQPGTTLPAGWTSYTDPGQFSIGLPPGWSASAPTASEVDFTGPQPGLTALVQWTTTPQADAYDDWQNQSAQRGGWDPAYQEIAISRVDYRGWNTADWEFLGTYQGQVDHFLDRGFIVTPGQLGYAILIRCPDAQFATVRDAVWDGLTQTFQPLP